MTNATFDSAKIEQRNKYRNKINYNLVSPLQLDNNEVVPIGKLFDELKGDKLIVDALNSYIHNWSFDDLPKYKRIPLMSINVDLSIQRAYIRKHLANIVRNFDPRWLQTVNCIKKPGKEVYDAVDGQHTILITLLMIWYGIILGKKLEDVTIMVMYVETDDRSFARKTFNLVNGAGKEKLSGFVQFKNRVLAAHIDGSTELEDLDALAKFKIFQKYQIIPIDKVIHRKMVKDPGVVTLYEFDSTTYSVEDTETAARWHYDYFHTDSVSHSIWWIIRDLKNKWGNGFKLTDTLLRDLACMIVNHWSDPDKFTQIAKNAWKAYTYDKDGTVSPWKAEVLTTLLLQCYAERGGTEYIPPAVLNEYGTSTPTVYNKLVEYVTY